MTTAFGKPDTIAGYGSAAHIQGDGAFRPHVQSADCGSSDALLPSSGRHHPHLDLTRIICVALVVIDHGAPAYSRANVLLTQNWVLQFLFLVSGVCFAHSTKSVFGYLGRCCLYFIGGVACNIIAWQWQGWDWKSDIFNTVFQFWFVVGLMLFAIILTPLKLYLQRFTTAQSNPNPAGDHCKRDFVRSMVLLVLLRLALGVSKTWMVQQLSAHPSTESSGLGFWGWPSDSDGASLFIDKAVGYASESLCGIAVVLIGTMVLPHVAHVAWSLLAYVYGMRIFFFHGQEDKPFHTLHLFMLAMVCYFLGIRFRCRISNFLLRYWVPMLVLMTLLWPPGLLRRMESDPPTTFHMRLRYNTIELVCVVAWLTSAERLLDARIFTEDSMEWVCNWALTLFLVHKAVHIVLPAPWNWIILCLIGLPYWLSHRAGYGRIDSSVKHRSQGCTSHKDCEADTAVEGSR